MSNTEVPRKMRSLFNWVVGATCDRILSGRVSPETYVTRYHLSKPASSYSLPGRRISRVGVGSRE